MEHSNSMKFIRHPLIPNGIQVAVRSVSPVTEQILVGKERRLREHQGGRQLIADMVSQTLGKGEFHVEGTANNKPKGIYNGESVELSIAHSRHLIGGAVSKTTRVGIDVEPLGRQCHPRLLPRILHPQEHPLSEQIETLQLWTMKEAVLKWEGSGLRMAMNRVLICRQNSELFRGRIPGGRKVEICSFIGHDHWIALAWGPGEGGKP